MKVRMCLLAVRIMDALMWGLVAFGTIAGILGAVAGVVMGIAAITLWVLLVGRSTVLVPILAFGLLVVAMSRGIYRLQLAHPQTISKRMVIGFWLLAGVGFPAVIIEAVWGPVERVYAMLNTAGELVDHKLPTRSTSAAPRPKPSGKSGPPVRPTVSEKSRTPNDIPQKTPVLKKPGLGQPEIDMRKTRPVSSSSR